MLVLTTFDLDEYVYEALRAGASGFLLKDARRSELVDGVRVVAARRRAARARVTRRLIDEFAAPAAGPRGRRATSTGSPTASARCCGLVARGMSNAEIAEPLCSSARRR